MEMLILAAVAAFWVRNAATDVVALTTGRTPPSHAYRMAKMRERQARERRKWEADQDRRGGLAMVARHWYLDACEDLDHWRAHRHATKPERKAARRERQAEREGFTSRWGWRRRDPMPDDVIDAEIVDDEHEFAPDEPPPAPPGGGATTPPPSNTSQGTRRRRTTTTTTSTVTEEEEGPAPAPGVEVVLVEPDEETLRPPLPHRRMMLMTMLANAGYDPDPEAIGQMSSEEVDGAITAMVEHERATRTASH
ncbi:hypothetical protein [Nocardiopsis alba]|uniref:hypothetical protein n=1 Tax=Nocardiopsis alba TaxID=53437 RepID=UPI00339EDB1A